MKEYFRVKASKYIAGKNFDIVRPASINNPKDNAVMFISAGYMDQKEAFRKCNNCLIFGPKEEPIPDDIAARHAVCIVENKNIIGIPGQICRIGEESFDVLCDEGILRVTDWDNVDQTKMFVGHKLK